MKTFLSERKQFVQINGKRSDKLVIGDNSVIQGSTLSCLLFLIYVLDLPQIFSTNKDISPSDQKTTKSPTTKTFVDNIFTIIQKEESKDLATSVRETMDKINKYTEANKLVLNQDKTLAMVISKNQSTKDNFTVILGGKEIRHQRTVKILGNIISDKLTWEDHVSREVIPALRNRVRTLRVVNKYLDPHFQRIYSNGIYRSKLLFGIESWGGVNQTLTSKIQTIQNQASKLALSKKQQWKSSRQRQQLLQWLPIQQKIDFATHKATFRIINQGIPEEISSVMPQN